MRRIDTWDPDFYSGYSISDLEKEIAEIFKRYYRTRRIYPLEKYDIEFQRNNRCKQILISIEIDMADERYMVLHDLMRDCLDDVCEFNYIFEDIDDYEAGASLVMFEEESDMLKFQLKYG